MAEALVTMAEARKWPVYSAARPAGWSAVLLRLNRPGPQTLAAYFITPRSRTVPPLYLNLASFQLGAENMFRALFEHVYSSTG